jgi:predicted O-methyltransferase YrrM
VAATDKNTEHESGASDSEVLIRALYQQFLGRAAAPGEVQHWLSNFHDVASVGRLVASLAAAARKTKSEQVPVTYPAGHFYSPVVDPGTVRDYVARSMQTRPEEIAGIDLDLEAMRAYWMAHREVLAATPFSDEPNGRDRYYYQGGPYPYGDAIMLRAIIAAQRPRRIVEIGSGFSTACMLDSLDHFGLQHTRITCIEPFTARLRSVLRPGDDARVEIIERPVQGLGLETFAALEANDVLFIDSTHVLKTGSDVHYELFHILPTLKQGVLVHFHDCRYPFEYPSEFIFQRNYSWNEAYALRAFLMYNSKFRVFFYNSLFAKHAGNLVAATCPAFLRNPGSSIWLMVQ